MSSLTYNYMQIKQVDFDPKVYKPHKTCDVMKKKFE